MERTRTDEIVSLLDIAIFSRKSIKRISHLSAPELATLLAYKPEDLRILPNYALEIHNLLIKADFIRKQGSERPRVTNELARTACILSCIKHIGENGYSNLLAGQFRALVSLGVGPAFFELLFDIEQTAPMPASGITISTLSAIQFLTLYRDELLQPPRFRTKNTFEGYAHPIVELSDSSWLDEDDETYLAAIRNMPFETFFEELPIIQPVLDWFVETKPTLDKNQLKLGWRYLESKSSSWHEQIPSDESFAALASEQPSWKCILSEYSNSNLSVLPKDSPYRIIPLSTPQQLLEESQTMHHCVASYIDYCIEGSTRIFSVRLAVTNDRYATAELSLCKGEWQLMQLKGKSNRELIQLMNSPDDNLTIAIKTLIAWYNQHYKEYSI